MQLPAVSSDWKLLFPQRGTEWIVVVPITRRADSTSVSVSPPARRELATRAASEKSTTFPAGLNGSDVTISLRRDSPSKLSLRGGIGHSAAVGVMVDSGVFGGKGS